MGLISRVSSRTYRHLKNSSLMPPVKRKRDALIKKRLEGLADSELRDHCKSLGLNAGPINKQTKSVWIRRCVQKEIEELEVSTKVSKIKEKDAFEFSADEEALTGKVETVREAAEKSTQKNDESEMKLDESLDEQDFSDKDSDDYNSSDEIDSKRGSKESTKYK